MTTLADSSMWPEDWPLQAIVEIERREDEIDELRAEIERLRNCISEAPQWVRTDDRKPEDGQTVLGCWKVDGSKKICAMESLTYGAADSPIDGPEVWSHWDGEKADEPDYWMPLEALGEPK